MLILGLGGQVLGFLGVLGSGALGAERIVAMLRYLSRPYWALLSAVHLAVTLGAALSAGKALTRKVYPASGEAGDLMLEEGEAV